MTKTAETGRPGECYLCDRGIPLVPFNHSYHAGSPPPAGDMRCRAYRGEPGSPGGGAAPEAEKLAEEIVWALSVPGHAVAGYSKAKVALIQTNIALALEATRAAALEEAAEVGSQEAWDTAYAEEKAVSKGGAPYTAAFRAANAASRIGTAIRALANPEDKG